MAGAIMERYRKFFALVVWAAAAIFGATRLAGDKVLMLRLIEALMVLISAFVALKAIDLIFPPKRPMKTVEKKWADASDNDCPAPTP